ncbi:transporter [Virgibacillus sediminis]|uniref:Transporter n=1 Tax=Virgibacillus sediminis TaxID=202260 RepID=A0ABV7A7K4_9BACI
MQQATKTIYETIMLLLVMVTLAGIWTDNAYNSIIHWLVWGIFVVDFLIRFLTADEKWEFVKQHPFLLLAIIPFDQFFQVARIVRIIYLFRIKTITKYYITPVIEKLTYSSLLRLAGAVLCLVLIESLFLWQLESSMDSYLGSFYITGTRLILFGREVDSIEHPLSIFLLTGTSVIGVLLQGIALQWGFSKAETIYRKRKGRTKGMVVEKKSQ